MKIDFNENLKWAKSTKLWETTPTHQSYFDMASLDHMSAGFIFYILVNTYVKKPIKTFIIIVIIHAIEDILENSTIDGRNYSLEGLVSTTFQCNNPAFLDTQDHDSLQNYLGDNISFIVGAWLGMCFEKHIKISKFYIWLIVVVWILLHPLSCHFLKSS